MTAEQLKLLTGIITETAAAEDFLTFKHAFVELKNFITHVEHSVLSNFGIIHTGTKTTIGLDSGETHSRYYIECTPGSDKIKEIYTRATRIYPI